MNPLSTSLSLSGTDLRLLNEIAFLSRLQAKRSPTGAKYCTPSRAYLARKLCCCVSTVSRRVSKLKSSNMLKVCQRRPVGGRWQSNLYRVCTRLGWIASGVVNKLFSKKYRVTEMPHIASSEGEINCKIPSTHDQETTSILKTWYARGQNSG